MVRLDAQISWHFRFHKPRSRRKRMAIGIAKPVDGRLCRFSVRLLLDPLHLEVAGDCGDPIGFGRDHGNRPPVVQLGAEPVAVEGFARQQGGEVEIRQKRGDPHAVVSGSRTNRTRLPSASTSATIVKPPRERPMACVLVPPLAPLPCWCTRTMVPSTMTYSKSASADKASKS